jgi:Cof subfamily protein (haloacid dehalogenase superfamily)
MSNSYKAVFLDVDGTILTSHRSIAPGTKETLTRLHNKGLLISVVTARSPDATLLIFNQLHIPDNPIICFNGALILQNENIIADYSIATEDVKQIKEALKNFNLTFTFYRYRDWFAEEITPMIQHEINVTKTKITLVDFSNENTFNTSHKILFMGEAKEVAAAEKYLKSLNKFDVTMNRSKATYLEIVNSKASKMLGIKKVIELKNITKEEIITIGDNYNDIDMLAFAPTSVAMGNAPDDVKKYASMVTDTNNNEGIQKALNLLIP